MNEGSVVRSPVSAKRVSKCPWSKGMAIDVLVYAQMVTAPNE